MEFMRHIIHQNDNPWLPNLAQRSSPKLISKSMIKSEGSRSEKKQYESEDQSDSEDGQRSPLGQHHCMSMSNGGEKFADLVLKSKEEAPLSSRKSNIKSRPSRAGGKSLERDRSHTSKSSINCGCHKEVLIVDDNHYNYVAVKQMLRQSLYLNTEKAENGSVGVEAYRADAVKLCCKRNFKLILMDL